MEKEVVKKVKLEEPVSYEILDKDSRNFLLNVISVNHDYYYALNVYEIDDNQCCGERTTSRLALIVADTQEKIINIKNNFFNWLKRNKDKYDLSIGRNDFDYKVEYLDERMLKKDEVQQLHNRKKKYKSLNITVENTFFEKKDIDSVMMINLRAAEMIINRFDHEHMLIFYLSAEPEDDEQRERFVKKEKEIKDYLRE